MPEIGNDVWIGGAVTLARGISLGDGCIVAANSVVTRSVPPYAVVGGNPAKIIKMRFDEATIEKLMETAWWNYKFTDFATMRYDDVNCFLDEFYERKRGGALNEFRPSEVRKRVADLLSAEIIA